jgi:hypothetical protein
MSLTHSHRDELGFTLQGTMMQPACMEDTAQQPSDTFPELNDTGMRKTWHKNKDPYCGLITSTGRCTWLLRQQTIA